MRQLSEFANDLARSLVDGQGLSRVVTLAFEGRCLCQEPAQYRRGFACPVHDGHELGSCGDERCADCRDWYRDQAADWAVDEAGR